jgi:hypothetical protein
VVSAGVPDEIITADLVEHLYGSTRGVIPIGRPGRRW